MSLPAIRAIRGAFPAAQIAVVARPWVADLYARETAIDRVIPYPKPAGIGAKRAFAASLRAERFDAAILLQNALTPRSWLGWRAFRFASATAATAEAFCSPMRSPFQRPAPFPLTNASITWNCSAAAGLIAGFSPNEAIRLGGSRPPAKPGPHGWPRWGSRDPPSASAPAPPRERQALDAGTVRRGRGAGGEAGFQAARRVERSRLRLSRGAPPLRGRGTEPPPRGPRRAQPRR